MGRVAVEMGRVAVEKKIEAFLDLELLGMQYVVGDGPYLHIRFVGQKLAEELPAHVGAADVFVLPCLTDTFGLVMPTATASGVPVAAFPIIGPVDVVHHGKTGILDRDLRTAVLRALELDPDDCLAYAGPHTWLEWTPPFVSLFEPIELHRWRTRRHSPAAPEINPSTGIQPRTPLHQRRFMLLDDPSKTPQATHQSASVPPTQTGHSTHSVSKDS